MRPPSRIQMLKDLRDGPYKGRGGVAVLCADLGVGRQALKNWRAGDGPDYAHRQVLIALWQKHCGEDTE